jgi:predicted PolB exonuclease-like 3'-5' exonuclease
MKRLVIDIETVGTPFEEHDPYVREYLLKGLNEAEAEEEKRRGALSPFTGRIIAIGVIRLDDGRSCALYEVPGQNELLVEKTGTRTYISGSEKQILEKFWAFFDNDSRFITFNGRQFDGPFLMLRSAINGVPPKRDLVGYRQSFHPNCDLREALSFFGATFGRQFRFNLDLACKAFGVTTSKGEGIDGRSVDTWYKAGRYREIADYCLDDVRATAELYERLVPTVLALNKDFRDAEERSPRRRPGDPEQLSIIPAPDAMPSPDVSFVESVTQSSRTLTSSLEELESSGSPPDPEHMTRQQALVLEKLVQAVENEEEIPI